MLARETEQKPPSFLEFRDTGKRAGKSEVGGMQTLLETEPITEGVEPEPSSDGQLRPVCDSGTN